MARLILSMVAQCGDGARGRKAPKMWQKSLKNKWVKARADVAEPDLAMWHYLNAQKLVGLVGST